MYYDVEGVGLVIFDKALSLFALSKPKYWVKDKDRVFISYGCVGGKVEEGESIMEAALREAHEEISTDVRIISSEKSYIIDLDLKVHLLKQEWSINPIAIYFVKYPGKPGDPSNTKQSFIGKVHVFLCELNGQPKPASEVPAILWTDWKVIQDNIGSYFPLSKFLEGGKIEEQKEIPRNAYLYPMWTPEILGKAFEGQDLKRILNID